METRYLKSSQRVSYAALIFSIIVGFASSKAVAQDKQESPSAPAADSGKSADSAKIGKLREQSRQKASAIEIHVGDGDAKTGELVKNPLMAYTDEPLCIDAGTVWAWARKENGRPLALCKVEHYDTTRIPRQGEWLYCFASLSTDLIRGDWPDGHKWSARQPGISYRNLPDAPPAGATQAARLRQMKEFARRFTGTSFLSKTQTEELRMLSQPFYRYSEPDSNILDGAVFAAVINGTNPTAMFLVELHEENGSQVWRFGIAAMTDGGVIVKYDGKQVWEKEALHAPGRDFGTWTYFFESPKR